MVLATYKFFKINSPSEHIFYLNYTKRFEGGAINLVSYDIGWSNCEAWYIYLGQDINFAPEWPNPKTLLDFFQKVLDDRYIEHNLVVYP